MGDAAAARQGLGARVAGLFLRILCPPPPRGQAFWSMVVRTQVAALLARSPLHHHHHTSALAAGSSATVLR